MTYVPIPREVVEQAQSQFRKKPVVITAHQWFKNGDHPEDRWSPEGVIPEDWEGRVVRYYRRPDVSGDSLCEQCGKPHHVHGWIDTLEQGHRVCPGDWIITGVKGERYPCKPDVFESTYEAASTSPEPAVPDAAKPDGPMTKEWVSNHPGAAAGMLNQMASTMITLITTKPPTPITTQRAGTSRLVIGMTTQRWP